MFQTKVVLKISSHTLTFFFSPEERAVYEIMCENIVEPDRPQMTVGACALNAVQLSLQTHIQNM